MTNYKEYDESLVAIRYLVNRADKHLKNGNERRMRTCLNSIKAIISEIEEQAKTGGSNE